jgi:DNA-nicking Smr family endonuclease
VKAKRTVPSLAELRHIQQALAVQAAAEAARQAEEKRRAQQARSDAELFRQAVGPVQPLRMAPQAALRRTQPPPPLPRQRQRDEAAALQETLSDAFDASTLLDTDEHLSYRRAGIGPDVTRKLRRGHWAIQAELDLHGLRTDEAREQLGAFIREARRLGLRCVRVVHGKGLGSPGKTPVLKGRVQGWLVQKKEVLAFVQARPAEGGAGALLVLLQPGG